MTFLEKLQKLPVTTKKIILWTVVVIIGIIFLTLWVRNFKERLKNFQPSLREGLKFPSLEKDRNQLLRMEIPKINEEELKKIEEELKKSQE